MLHEDPLNAAVDTAVPLYLRPSQAERTRAENAEKTEKTENS